MVDLQKLRHAVAVSSAGSYSAAARQIHISQSALTRSVNLLEETYGVRLFERGRSGAKLTLEGAHFLTIAEEALRGAQIAHDRLTQLAVAKPLVSFGMGPMTAAALLPDLLPRLRDQRSRYRIRILSNSALQLMLRQGDLDFFLGGIRKDSEIHALANQFTVNPIATAPMVLLVRPGHPLLSKDLTPEAVTAFPTASGSFVRETFGLATIARYGLQEPSLEIDDYHLLMSFVIESDHILICNRMLARTEMGLRLIPLDLEIDIANLSAWAIVSPGTVQLPSPAQRLIKIIIDVIETWTNKEAVPNASPE